MTLLQQIQSLKLIGQQSGNEFTTSCVNPECSNHQRTDKYKLSINLESGKWQCFVCGLKGANFKSFMMKAGLINLQEPVRDGIQRINPKELSGFTSRLNANEAGSLDYLLNQRGLTRASVTQFRLGYSAEEKAIVLPFFDHTGACVGLKFSYLDPNNDPKCRLRKGSKIQAYNLDCVDLTQPLMITEGEYDCISAWIAGFTNVISVPNGAQGMGDWVKEITGAPKYLLATDNDVPGQECAKKIAEIVGYSKCFRVYPKLKDFNDYLQTGLGVEGIKECFQAPEPMFEAPVFSIAEYQVKAQEALMNPTDLMGVSTGFASIDKLLAGIRMGEVTVSSGITSHGKTTFALALTNHMVLENNIKAMIISPEMREYDLLLGLSNNYYGEMVDDPAKVKEYCEVIKDKLYVANVFNRWNDKSSILDRTFDMIEYAVNTLGVKFVVVDHLRLFLNPSSADSERHAIDEFMQKCVHMASIVDVHLWVVVQPRALDSQTRKITQHHLKGSGNIIQDAHNIVLIHKEENEKKAWVEIEVPKVRSRLGTCGTAILEFDATSKANYKEIQ